MISFGIVGVGWRTEFYLRIAKACPDRFSVAGLVGRTPARAAAAANRFDVPFYNSVEELVQFAKPAYVVTSVPWEVNPGVLKTLAGLGVPTLSETPPASAVQEMGELYELVRNGARIQVAEQYFLQPHHAARLALVEGGKIGRVTQAQVSVAHGYHGISLIRRLLGIGYENAKITASVFKSPIVQGPGRAGPPSHEQIVDSEQVLAWLDFGDRLGVFDFTGSQYFAAIRDPRVLVRGERGEIVNNRAVYLKDFLTPVRIDFIRHSAGEHGNLEGHYLKGIQAGEEWIYKNPLAPASLFDDEIAIATCLLKMAEYAAGGPDFYSLAEACQDRYLDMVIQQSAREGRAITTETQAWAG
jgi:predicted dehydrogenase